MNVKFNADLRRFVERGVRTGRFTSPSQAVNAGLRLLREEEKRSRAEVRKKVEEGWADVRAGRVLDGPATMRTLREDLLRRAGERPD